MLYMVTFAINIPQMLAYIPYMDPTGKTQRPRSSVHRLFRWGTRDNIEQPDGAEGNERDERGEVEGAPPGAKMVHSGLC